MKRRPLRTYNIREAKTHLPKLLEQAVRGAEVIIARAGVPIARLVPMTPPVEERVLGTEVGRIVIADDFDAPLPNEIQESVDG